MKREKLSSRLGFILLSAGCAIGLGNIWRFPYMVGEYGGGAFVLVYLFFLIVLGLPIIVMEYSIGRASKKSIAQSFQLLEKKGQKWHWFSYVAMIGNYLLVMFYTTISGWMLAYFVKMLKGDFNGLTTVEVGKVFTDLQANPAASIFWMVLIVVIGCLICVLGLQRGVEKITKVMMGLLLGVMILLVIKSLSLSGAMKGVEFYLVPDFSALKENGVFNAIYAAMGQAFFTLSVGMGGMAIFGSYIDKSHRLLGETISVCTLDTLVALFSGLIIFPACFAFGVNPGSGPGLVFITLPSIFNEMWLGQVWGMLFFVFMSFAALSTIIAVFENIICFAMDLFNWSRKKAVIINLIVILILSLPCALGFNVLSDIAPLGAGTTIQDFEDFLVTYNFLPLGSLAYLIFCTTRYCWNFDNFIKEADTGKGLKFPKWTKNYLKYILPCIIIILFIQGYYMTFIK